MRAYLITSTPYGLLHHRFQKIADTLRGAGIPVTYVEHTYGWQSYLSGSRKGLLSELLRSCFYHLNALVRLAIGAEAREIQRGTDDVDENDFTVVSLPLVVPNNKYDSSFLDSLNAMVYRLVFEKEVLKKMVPGQKAVALADNPLWGKILHRSDFSHIVYDCIDELSVYAGRSSIVRAEENERLLLSKVDHIFVTAQSLENRLRVLAPRDRISRIPNGVDFDWFTTKALLPHRTTPRIPDDRPTVGYVGTLYEWIDFDLIQQIAARFQGLNFVLVGPVDSPKRLKNFESSNNLFWLGKKEYEEVPGYINSFDVCIIPFRSGRIAESTNPIKLFEYFALGKPVVTTPMLEIAPFTKNKLAYIGEGVEGFASALAEALGDKSDERRGARKEVARMHSWKVHVGKMLDVFDRLT